MPGKEGDSSRIVPRVIDHFSSTLTFDRHGASPMWGIRGETSEDNFLVKERLIKVAKQVQKTLADSSQIVRVSRPMLRETVVLQGGEGSVSIWKQYEGEEFKQDGIQFFGIPQVSMALDKERFSFLISREGEEVPFFEDHVTSEAAGQEGYLLSIGEIEVNRGNIYRFHGGITERNVCSKKRDEKRYENIQKAIAQTRTEQDRGELNSVGAYYQFAADRGGYIEYIVRYCKDVEVVEETRADVISPIALVGYENGWQFRQMDSHRLHLPL